VTDALIRPMAPKRLARIAGLFYLLLGVFGGFAQGFLWPSILVAGDAAATAANLRENAELIRFGVVAELLGQTFFVLLALALYALLRHVHAGAARLMVVLVILAVGITCVSVVFELEGLQIAIGADTSALGVDASNALALVMLELQHYGIFVAQLFFALWLTPLAYLTYKSGQFPRLLSLVLVLATVSYVIDLLVAILLPAVSANIHSYFGILPAIAEIGMVLFLLIFGVLTPKVDSTKERVAAPV